MITVAIVGVGSRGGMYGDRLVGVPDMKVVAFCDPNRELRETKGKEWGIAEENRFASADELFAKGKIADVAFICSPDRFHYAQTMQALKLGYDVQLEKPIAQTLQEALEIERYATEHGRTVLICYVLRYSTYFRKIKEIIDSGLIGKVQQIEQTENVDFRHFCRSYVRGQWNKVETSTPFLTAKSSHDMDLLCWWADSKPKKVTSFGDLSFYKPENKPQGATDDCRTCPLVEKCRFNAYNTYIVKSAGEKRKDRFRSKKKRAELYKTIPENQFKCAFSGENNVCDRQTVTIEMENGILCSFSAGGCRAIRGRNMYIQGTEGEIYAVEESHKIEVYTEHDKKIVYNLKREMKRGGHAGGDAGIMIAVHDVLTGKIKPETVSCVQKSIESQKLCEYAEVSRLAGGKTVDIAEEIKNTYGKGDSL